jgi:hypothetical protein
MAETQIWRVSRVRAARGQAAGGAGSRLRRAGVRLWTLLHAQALLSGTTGGPGDVVSIEEDYLRLAARRAR